MKEKGKTMKKLKIFVFVTLFAGMILAACQPAPVEDEFIFGEEAIVESVEVLLLESLPALGDAIVSGYLPDGCTELIEITVEQQDQQFILTLVTRRQTGDVACTEALVPFEEVVSLDIIGLEAGTYTVIAQDQQTEFTLYVDNVFGGERDDILIRSDAYVEGLSIDIMESYPVQVSVTITGNLPDGCTKIHDIRVHREESTFFIDVRTETPAGDVACTMALVPFEERVGLEVEGLAAGKYTVRVGDLRESFTLDTDN